MLRPRSEAWREAYSRSRYLNALSREALAERLRWLFENIATLTDQGQIGVEMPQGDQERLWAAFSDSCQEFQMRGENPPDQFLAGAQVPTASYPSPLREVSAYRQRDRSEPGQSFKFGRKEHLDALLNDGSIKIRAASYYRDPSLNGAVSDDELHFTLQPKISDLRLIGMDGSVTTVTLSNAIFALAHPSDFYIYCMSARFWPRLFKDFGYDSCLIIYDTTEFTRRLETTLERRHPGWSFLVTRTSYVDPNKPGSGPPVIPIAKHLRFAYQQEFRLIFHPPSSLPPPLPDLDLRIQPCGDIAEVISLDSKN